MSVFESDNVISNHDQTSNQSWAHLYYDAEQSSFEEVAGMCSNKDNSDIPCLTIRSFTIGLMFVIGMSYIHMWMYSVYAAPLIHPMLIILASHVLRKL
jgi:NADH:ubiquinone oxidoreductase subunit 2 (subunit N)